MTVYKDEKNGTWRVVFRFKSFTGERKQTQKRGFKTRREAFHMFWNVGKEIHQKSITSKSICWL